MAAVESAPKQLSIHLSLSALACLSTKQQPNAPLTVTVEALVAEAQALLPAGTDLPENFAEAVGEMCVICVIPMIPSTDNVVFQ